jgi:hypothetical protein
MSKVFRKSDICLNCDTPLSPDDNYCPHCGQENNTHKIPVKHIVLETFEDFFHFDTKLWNTIKTTFARPGKITVDYLEGKRARYVPPVKFYIFISFIFFLLLGKLSDYAIDGSNKKRSGVKNLEQTASITLNELLGNKKIYYSSDSSEVRLVGLEFTSIDNLQQQLKRLKTAPDRVIDSLLASEDIDTSKVSREKLRKMLSLIPESGKVFEKAKPAYVVYNKIRFETKEEYEQFKEDVRDYSDEQVDSLLRSKGETVNWFNRQMLKKLAKFDMKNKDDIKELTHAILKSISLTMFIMMPLTAILLLLIFYRRKYYYEHLIFSIHIHTIFFLILSFVLAIQVFVSDSFGEKLWLWVFLICLIYLVLSLKHNYLQSWRKTIMKFLLMAVPYLFISLLLTFFAVLYGFLA